MEEDNKVRYLAIALGMCGLTVSNYGAEIILKAIDAIDKMGGDFDLKTAAKIQVEAEEKYKTKSKPSIVRDGLEEFYNEALGQSLARPETDPLTANMILDGLKNLIEQHRGIPI